MIHCVVLVRRERPPEVAALLDGIAAGREPPRGFSIWGAAAAVDAASLQFCRAGGALAARTTAKAIARMARLPVFELYGEYPVFRPADRLDPSLSERLVREAPPADPGPPPAGLEIQRDAQTLALTLRGEPRSRTLPLALAAALGVVAVTLAIKVLAAGLAVLALAVLVAVVGLRARSSVLSRLIVDREHVRWLDEGREEALDTGSLEMMRIHETTLVLIGHSDELRCRFASEEAAAWARRAIERQLAPEPGDPYR